MRDFTNRIGNFIATTITHQDASKFDKYVDVEQKEMLEKITSVQKSIIQNVFIYFITLHQSTKGKSVLGVNWLILNLIWEILLFVIP